VSSFKNHLLNFLALPAKTVHKDRVRNFGSAKGGDAQGQWRAKNTAKGIQKSYP